MSLFLCGVCNPGASALCFDYRSVCISVPPCDREMAERSPKRNETVFCVQAGTGRGDELMKSKCTNEDCIQVRNDTVARRGNDTTPGKHTRKQTDRGRWEQTAKNRVVAGAMTETFSWNHQTSSVRDPESTTHLLAPQLSVWEYSSALRLFGLDIYWCQTLHWLIRWLLMDIS